MDVIIAVDVDQLYCVLSIGSFGLSINYISYFYLFSNRINYVPKELFNMYWIKMISLSGLLHGETFPKNIINMRKMVELLANNCCIKDLFEVTRLRKLVILNMDQSEKFNYDTAKTITIEKFVGTKNNKDGLKQVIGRELS